MPRYVKIRDVDIQGESATAWVPESEINAAGGGGGGSLTLETPTGAVNGVNTEFVFVGSPVAVFRNGVMQSPSVVTIAGTTATFNPAPADGEITGLTQ